MDYANAELVFAPGRGPTTMQSLRVRYAPLCVSTTCGDGSPQTGEQCDDGNMIDTDACPTTCFNAICGDGYVLAMVEQCDDGNDIPGDGCNSSCTIEGCGNGVLEPPEACDDGPANSNTTPDACRTSCLRASCGDGVTDTGEQCDDGNASSSDACLPSCQSARCGDGFVQSGVEHCDDGNMVDTDDCSNACTWNVPGFAITRTAGMPLVTTSSGSTTLTFSSQDDGSVAVAIPFPFSFLGRPTPNVWVGTNGFVNFDAASTSYTNVSLPTPSTPNALIAWWWDDLRPFLAGATPVTQAYQQVLGTTPNRRLAITLLNVPRFSGGRELLNVQIRLHETTNLIEVHYGSLGTTGLPSSAFSASVGWEDWTGTRGENALPCGASCTIADWPADTIFTYTP